MGLAHSPRIVTNGLILCLDAANLKSYPGSGTSVNNLILSNQSTLVGGVTYNSLNEGCFVFDGTSGYILFDQSYTISNQGGTFSCWMYIDDFVVVSGHTPGRITFGNTATNFASMLAVYNGGYGFESNTNSNPDELSGDVTPENSVPSVVAGTWINMTVVMSNTQHTFYTNGINHRTDSMIDNFTTNNFGEQANDTSYPDFFKGRVGNIQIYNRALSESEIQQNFNALRGRFGI